MTFIQKFVRGLLFLIEGKSLVFNLPPIRIWLAIPIGICVCLFLGGLTWGVAQVSDWSRLVLEHILNQAVAGSWYYGPLAFILRLIFFVAFSLSLLYFVIVISGVIAAPFYSVVAEIILQRNDLLPGRTFQFGSWLRVTFKMLGVSLVKSFIFLFLGVFLLILSIIPGLNLLAIYLTLLMLAFDSMDYGFEALQMTFRQRTAFVRRHWVEFMGMAVSLALTLVIPGLTLLLLPFAVVGATSLMAQLKKQEAA